MIESIKEIKTMKAIDLPPTFDVRVGLSSYRMERSPDRDGKVWMHCSDTSEDIHIDPDEIITVLVPDTWENARYDIQFDLMKEGLL